jgi:hypothetical protein
MRRHGLGRFVDDRLAGRWPGPRSSRSLVLVCEAPLSRLKTHDVAHRLAAAILPAGGLLRRPGQEMGGVEISAKSSAICSASLALP